MADGGSWLMSSGGGCALVVEADARWKRTMEGKRGIPRSLFLGLVNQRRCPTAVVVKVVCHINLGPGSLVLVFD